MKAILLLTDSFPELAAIATARPSCLIQLADKPILAHMVVTLLESDIDDVLVVAPASNQEAIVTWLADHLASYGVKVQAVSGEMSAVAALKTLSGSTLGGDSLVLLSQHTLVMDDSWQALVSTDVDAVVLSAGAVWLRDGKTAVAKLAETGANTLAEAVQLAGLSSVEKRPLQQFEIMTTDQLLQANKRLLGRGFSSAGVLERSYTEEFGVIPPVFIHKDAEIYSSMIGPYVTIGAGAVVENTVMRDSMVGAGGTVRELVLTDTIVGANATLEGRPLSVIVSDDSEKIV